MLHGKDRWGGGQCRWAAGAFFFFFFSPSQMDEVLLSFLHETAHTHALCWSSKGNEERVKRDLWEEGGGQKKHKNAGRASRTKAARDGVEYNIPTHPYITIIRRTYRVRAHNNNNTVHGPSGDASNPLDPTHLPSPKGAWRTYNAYPTQQS